jgi:hypothetical protein
VALLLLGNLLGGLLLLLCHRYGSLPRVPGHTTHDRSLGHSIEGTGRRFEPCFVAVFFLVFRRGESRFPAA